MKPNIELLNLKGKSAIVTGGAKGIGLGIASRLAEAGAKIVIADIDETAGGEAVKKLGENAKFLKVDVSNEDDMQNMVSFCKENFGAVDILVNNAGIFPNQTLASMSLADFEKVVDINLRGVMLATKHASEIMKQNGGGKIINITSIDAIHPSMIGLSHYDASKHGVWGFTMNAALELSEHNIWVNAIAPGGILTPGVSNMQSGNSDSSQIEAFIAKIPMRRLGEPDEIGKVALFLASEMSSYITGTQIVADGGALLT